jgi:ATP-dependent helicase/DNAse subunit B
VEEISAMDRGSLIHHVLELFITEAMEADGGMLKPQEPWSKEHRIRLHQIATDTFADYEARGRTGRPVHWEVRKKDLLAVLDSFLMADNTFRQGAGATPVRVELPFGLQGAEPLQIELPNGRSLRFRGVADRVDTTADGRVIVSDYKSGKSDKYNDLGIDPVQAGRTLQLGLYAEAARRETGLEEASAAYWMLEADARNTRKGYEWTDDRRDRFIDVLTTITDGIAGGVFAADPGDWNTWRQTNESCTYCQFDSVCPRARGDQQAAKADAPELSIRSKLILEEQE